MRPPCRSHLGTGQAWLATDVGSTQVMVAGSREEVVLREHLQFFGRPLATDGYRPYRSLFGTLQRCWAHISRESKNHVRIAEMRSGISSTHCCDI